MNQWYLRSILPITQVRVLSTSLLNRFSSHFLGLNWGSWYHIHIGQCETIVCIISLQAVRCAQDQSPAVCGKTAADTAVLGRCYATCWERVGPCNEVRQPPLWNAVYPSVYPWYEATDGSSTWATFRFWKVTRVFCKKHYVLFMVFQKNTNNIMTLHKNTRYTYCYPIVIKDPK